MEMTIQEAFVLTIIRNKIFMSTITSDGSDIIFAGCMLAIGQPLTT